MRLLVCVGYSPGELIPNGHGPYPVQTRILEFIAHTELEKILVRDTHELAQFIDKIRDAGRIQIVGAWYDHCVFSTACLIDRIGARVNIDPDLTLSRLEALGVSEDDSGYKREWLMSSVSTAGLVHVEVKRD